MTQEQVKQLLIGCDTIYMNHTLSAAIYYDGFTFGLDVVTLTLSDRTSGAIRISDYIWSKDEEGQYIVLTSCI